MLSLYKYLAYYTDNNYKVDCMHDYIDVVYNTIVISL